MYTLHDFHSRQIAELFTLQNFKIVVVSTLHDLSVTEGVTNSKIFHQDKPPTSLSGPQTMFCHENRHVKGHRNPPRVFPSLCVLHSHWLQVVSALIVSHNQVTTQLYLDSPRSRYSAC